jgi:hypothetical protein
VRCPLFPSCNEIALIRTAADVALSASEFALASA